MRAVVSVLGALLFEFIGEERKRGNEGLFIRR
jgi:hypothetical protein